MASTYPSTQWSNEVVRGRLPMFAGSDIMQGAPVTVASSGDWTVIMCTSSAQKPIGIARDYAIAGNAVNVKDMGNVVRDYVAGTGAGASFSRQAYLGVIGTSSGVHPQSGVSVTFPVLGQVAIGSQGQATVYAVGQAWESAAIGDFAAYRIEPTLLSGLVSA
jgi:hypothetical protein